VTEVALSMLRAMENCRSIETNLKNIYALSNLWFSGVLRCVTLWLDTDVSEDRDASILKVKVVRWR